MTHNLINTFKNYYTILNIKEEATEDEIYTAYREKIAQFNGLPFHTQQMINIIKELKEAIYVLGDSKKRTKYNNILVKYKKTLKYTNNSNENTKIYSRMFDISR